MLKPNTQAVSRQAALLGMLVALLVLTACGSPVQSPGSSAATANGNTGHKTIKAITTMSVLADMIKQVGGQRVEAENIIPVGAGPEDYQPSPSAAQKIAEADIVFYNGFGLEAWLDDLFKSAGNSQQPQVAVAQGLTPLDVGDEEFKAGNPHFWMSAAYGVKYVETIRDSLSKLDPAGKELYTNNAASYIQQLLDLNAELKQQAARIPPPERKLVTNHDAFPYFANEYGFTIVGNVLGNPEAEPSAGDLAELVTRIKAQQVKAVFSESQFSSRLTQTIASETGVKVVSNLYTDTLGAPGSEVTTYIAMLRYDMQTIVDALQ